MFFVGLLNTLVVAVIGIFFATVIGFLVALGRLSPNWLLARISGGYVELVRNIPLLFQILFWYLAVLGALPPPTAKHFVVRYIFPFTTAGWSFRSQFRIRRLKPVAIALLIAIVGFAVCCGFMRSGNCFRAAG